MFVETTRPLDKREKEDLFKRAAEIKDNRSISPWAHLGCSVLLILFGSLPYFFNPSDPVNAALFQRKGIRGVAVDGIPRDHVIAEREELAAPGSRHPQVIAGDHGIRHPQC